MSNKSNKKSVSNLVSASVKTDIKAAIKAAGGNPPTDGEIEAKALRTRTQATNARRVMAVGTEVTVNSSNSVSIEVFNGNYWFAVNCEGGQKINLARLCHQNLVGYGTDTIAQWIDDPNATEEIKATAESAPNKDYEGAFPEFIDVFDAYEKIKANPAKIAGKTLRYGGIVTKKFVARSPFKVFTTDDKGKQVQKPVKVGAVRAMTAQLWTLED